MSGHPIPDPPPTVPRCTRCGCACPHCADEALPDGWTVVQFGDARTAVVDADRGADPGQIARQVRDQGRRPRRVRRI